MFLWNDRRRERNRVTLTAVRPTSGMGFGSYDESEQQNQAIDDDDGSEGVTVHENDHEGEVSFETDASTDDLVDQLSEIKDDE